MPRPEIEAITRQHLRDLSAQYNTAISRVIVFQDVLIGNKRSMPWRKSPLGVPKPYNIANASDAVEWAERKQRGEDPNKKDPNNHTAYTAY